MQLKKYGLPTSAPNVKFRENKLHTLVELATIKIEAVKIGDWFLYLENFFLTEICAKKKKIFWIYNTIDEIWPESETDFFSDQIKNLDILVKLATIKI